METIVTVVHLLVALAIIGLILMQQGKGAEAGASFGGGASQTVFGSQGGGNFFAKATAVFAFVFFASSFTLAVIAKDKTEIDTVDGMPVLFEQVQESEIPFAEGPVALESELPAVPAVSDTVSDVPVVDDQSAQ
ncbi:MAG: preprotein translocase subunit SecG [Candidatus Endobugula sp.]|jgi:preprotein translocase subunit SecG